MKKVYRVILVIIIIIIITMLYKYNRTIDFENESIPMNVYLSKKQVSDFVKWKYGKDYKAVEKKDIYRGSFTRYQFQKGKEKFYVYTEKEIAQEILNGGLVATSNWYTEIYSWYLGDIQECYSEEIKEISNKYGLKINEHYSRPAISSGDESNYHKIYGFEFVDITLNDIDNLAECLVELDKLFDFNINDSLKSQTGGYYRFNDSCEVRAPKNEKERKKYDKDYYKENIIKEMKK